MNQCEAIEKHIQEAASLEELAIGLRLLFNGNLSVWRDGQLYNTKQLVDRVNGLRLEIFSHEHSPPHFHVKGGAIDATFSIADGSLLRGKINSRQRALLAWWYERSRKKLIEIWNHTRPSNCSVGPIEE
jgi:hypothetical protein